MDRWWICQVVSIIPHLIVGLNVAMDPGDAAALECRVAGFAFRGDLPW